jgi:hypothetical protein
MRVRKRPWRGQEDFSNAMMETLRPKVRSTRLQVCSWALEIPKNPKNDYPRQAMVFHTSGRCIRDREALDAVHGSGSHVSRGREGAMASC